ncbi:hypothetical protein HC928_26035, partial [bacterium]|nr:hypothetical protein [bacterium]
MHALVCQRPFFACAWLSLGGIAQAQPTCAAPMRVATWNIENFDFTRADDPDMLG